MILTINLYVCEGQVGPLLMLEPSRRRGVLTTQQNCLGEFSGAEKVRKFGGVGQVSHIRLDTLTVDGIALVQRSYQF